MVQFDHSWIIPDSGNDAYFYSSFSRRVCVLIHSLAELSTMQDSLHILETELLETDSISFTQSKEWIGGLFDGVDLGSISYAILFLNDGVIYVFTHGEASSFLARDGKTYTLSTGTQEVSGKVLEQDTIALAVGDLTERKELQALVTTKSNGGQDMKQVISGLYEEEDMDQFGHCALVSLAVIQSDIQEGHAGIIEHASEQPGTVQTSLPHEERVVDDNVPLPSKKKLYIVVAVLLLCLVGWSTVFGSQRRNQKEFDAKVLTARTSIEKKVAEAEDIGSVDPSEGLSILSSVKGEVEALSAYAKEKNIKDTSSLSDLQKYVETAEKEISKEEQTTPEEFYDLALVSKSANGSALSLEGDMLTITDSEDKKAYTLSLEEKSVKELSLKGISSVQKVVGSEERVYVLGSDGVWKLGEKNEKQITSDGWGSIQDIGIFNGNIYLLDSGKQMIWKYLVAENGFSEAQQYIKEQNSRLESGESMVIDGAIYVGTSQTVLKFASGQPEPLKLEAPVAIASDDVAVSQEQDVLAVLDKAKSKLFLFSKTGGYKKQILAKEIAAAKDIVVTDEGEALILSGNKLYKFE